MKKYIFKIIYIINLFIIFAFILYIINLKYNSKELNLSSKININSKHSNSYKNTLIIPKISLNKEFIKYKDDKTLNKSIAYYDNLNTDNKIIIFGHSGLGYGTYFNRLDELNINDNAYLYVDNIKYNYKLNSKYNVSKYSTYVLNDEVNSNKLLLITCNKSNKKMRLILEFIKNSS